MQHRLLNLFLGGQASFNYLLNSSFDHLLHSLPLTLADHAHAYEIPEEPQHPVVEEQHEEDNGEISEEKTALTGVKPHSATAQTPTDFEHPAVREPLRPIWMAADPLGLGNSEAEVMTAGGIQASTTHATVDEDCNVQVDGTPPGGDE